MAKAMIRRPSASQCLNRSSFRLNMQFFRGIDLQPENRAEEQKRGHGNKGSVVAMEVFNNVTIDHRRKQASYSGRGVHQPDDGSRLLPSDIQANCEHARLLKCDESIDQ